MNLAPRRKALFFLAAALLAVGGWYYAGLLTSRGLAYWQNQAAKVHVGMLRGDVEKLLPVERYESLLWKVEDLRFRHAPSLPPLARALEFKQTSSNLWTHQMYELEAGVAVVIRYDTSGSVPARTHAGRGVQQPGDRVIILPVVTDTAAAARLHAEHWRHP